MAEHNYNNVAMPGLPNSTTYRHLELFLFRRLKEL